MNIDEKEIRKALAKTIKKGIVLDIEYYDRDWLAKECVKEVNKTLIPEGYSVTLRDSIFFDVYYIQKAGKVTTITISEKGLTFDQNLKSEWAAAISPVVRVMMDTIIKLIES